jgi:SpoVK/Ycf46/Vps4 family AAA+-type ATPase
MTKRRLDMKEQKKVNRRKVRLNKLVKAPPINSIKDLIEIGHSVNLYKNLDTIMLWRITPYLEELDKMIGMQSLKQSIFHQILYYIQGMHTKNSNEYLHIMIFGPPGCGKTTVAKIIAKIYQNMGILSKKGTFKIAHRDDFIAGYLGQTAIKTQKLLKSCIGGVLFIDEVYSLAPRDNDRDSFSKEAIDILNAFLSENKQNFCCIAAGYEEEVKKTFFNMNKGLRRRFPWIHKIEEYSSTELSEILLKMIREQNWKISINNNKLIEIIENNKFLFKFGGGDIETFVDKCKIMHSTRVFSLNPEHKFILTEKDLLNSIEILKKNYDNDNNDKNIPFGLYM